MGTFLQCWVFGEQTDHRFKVLQCKASDMNEFSQFLREMAQAADSAYIHAMNTMTAAQRSQDIGLGGDGTPTMFLDAYIERPVLEIIEREGHNVLSEEVGWIDRG